MSKEPCTYMLASGRMGTIYVGVTSDIAARLRRHRAASRSSFTGRYEVTRLIRYERFEDMPSAIAREKQLKRWHREWKINLIERDNPEWLDLAPEVGLPVAVGVRAGHGGAGVGGDPPPPDARARRRPGP